MREVALLRGPSGRRHLRLVGHPDTVDVVAIEVDEDAGGLAGLGVALEGDPGAVEVGGNHR